MEIRDIVHGAIDIHPDELAIVDSPYFQRLRQIKQLGFSEYSFPTASHNRYTHSLGAMETSTKVFHSIFQNSQFKLDETSYFKFLKVVRMAALLHDIGHGPLSHTTEFVMPPLSQLRPSVSEDENRQATHEDYTLKILLDSGLTPILEKIGRPYHFQPLHIAALIDAHLPSKEIQDFFIVKSSDGEEINFLPILRQMISSELDADRMDYLRRDSYYAGVSYGNFDFRWLSTNLTSHIKDQNCYLGLQHRALYTFEDFLISRYHMFLMVYFHYKSVVFDAMLRKYFESSDCNYQLPTDIESYHRYDDAHLFSHLADSQNPWAQRITQKKPFKLLIEIHSGIPNDLPSYQEKDHIFQEVKSDLNKKGIFYLEANSTGELSKYFRKPGDPIFIRYDNYYNSSEFLPLERCTNLFDRYREKRVITRIYVSPEDYAQLKKDRRFHRKKEFSSAERIQKEI